MEGSSRWETHDGGLEGHAHGNRPEQRRPGSSCEELTELLSTHPKAPHVTCMTGTHERRHTVKEKTSKLRMKMSN